MTFANQIRDHQSRCHPHLLRLRLVARGEANVTAPAQIVAEVRDATNAILTEAESAIRAALATAADRPREPATETFLWARLARLATAADEAVSAARGGHAPGLRARLRRFDALTSAIWTVQHAAYGQVPPPRPASDAARREARDGADPVLETMPSHRSTRAEGLAERRKDNEVQREGRHATQVVSVRADASFKEMAAGLREHHVSAFPVVDDDGMLIGVVSEADMLPKKALEEEASGIPGLVAGILQRRDQEKAGAVVAAGLTTRPAVTVMPARTRRSAGRSLMR